MAYSESVAELRRVLSDSLRADSIESQLPHVVELVRRYRLIGQVTAAARDEEGQVRAEAKGMLKKWSTHLSDFARAGPPAPP